MMYYQFDMEFSERIVRELEKKGWSRSEAARRGGISSSMFDKVINGYAKPGIKFLKGIAQAFEISLAEVLTWLEPSHRQGTDEDFEELKHLFNQMTDEEQAEFLAMGRLKLELRNKRGELRETQQARPAHV